MRTTMAMTAELAGEALRAAWYFGLNRLVTWRTDRLGMARRYAASLPVPSLGELLADEARLLVGDALAVADGLYPPLVGLPDPLGHLARVGRMLADLPDALGRRASADATSARAEPAAARVPHYYAQDFHFQTGGYLSEASARLYDVQVETLFMGAAAPMRRTALRAVCEHLRGRDQRRMRLIDVACGTGRFLREVRLALPALGLTGIDLSRAYLMEARRHLGGLRRVALTAAAGEQLPFAAASIDVVTAIFLYHELPPEVRRQSGVRDRDPVPFQADGAGAALNRLARTAERVGEAVEAVGDDVPGAFGTEIARLSGAVFPWARDKARAHAGRGRGRKVAVVRGDEHDRAGLEVEQADVGEIGLALRLVGARRLRAENDVPRQLGVLGHAREQANVAVRKGADDEAPLEPVETANRVRPGPQAVPDLGEVVFVCFLEPADRVFGKQLVEALAVEHVKDRKRAAPRAHLFHGRLVEAAPVVGERRPVGGETAFGGEGADVVDEAAAPVDDGAKDVEQQRLDARSNRHGSNSFSQRLGPISRESVHAMCSAGSCSVCCARTSGSGCVRRHRRRGRRAHTATS